MPQALPANPDLDWLRKTAKQRLMALRAVAPGARLHQAQLALAQAYGFASWRALKAHVESANPKVAARAVFAAAQAGDIDGVRRALAAGFDLATQDADGRTIHQIAKDRRHAAIERLVRDVQGGALPPERAQAIHEVLVAAQSGDVAGLRSRLDARPDLIDALGGGGFEKAAALHLAALRNRHDAVRFLIGRGADLNRREFPDNAAPLHLAAMHGDLETIRLLVEAGADVDGAGDDHGVGVLGWACCFAGVREDVAAYLLGRGARLTLWTAIALDRADELRAMIAHDPSLLAARMTRNQHRRTALHHAAFKNRPQIVKLLLALGADPHALDASGATALTTASQEGADQAVVAALLAAGSRPDLLTAVNLARYDDAKAMLRQDPTRLGPEGSDTIALHLSVSKRNLVALRWLLDHGVDVNARRSMWDCNHTALQMAIERGEMEIAQLLLEAGADPNIRDGKYESTALGWAEFFGRDDFAELIRGTGGVK